MAYQTAAGRDVKVKALLILSTELPGIQERWWEARAGADSRIARDGGCAGAARLFSHIRLDEPESLGDIPYGDGIAINGRLKRINRNQNFWEN